MYFLQGHYDHESTPVLPELYSNLADAIQAAVKNLMEYHAVSVWEIGRLALIDVLFVEQVSHWSTRLPLPLLWTYQWTNQGEYTNQLVFEAIGGLVS